MWTRKELKERGKISFKRNYWKAVLIALILSFIAGGGSGGSSSGSSLSTFINSQTNRRMSEVSETDENDEGFGLIGEVDEDTANDSEDADNGNVESVTESDVDFDISFDTETGQVEFKNGDSYQFTDEEMAGFGVMFILTFLIVFFLIFAIVIAMDVLLLNPLEMGCRRYFFKNLDEPANISNVAYAFDHNYKNVIKVMFFRDLYSTLWSMLFIIPGIVKSYEYRMIPYLLAENPDMTKEDAFAMSREMMKGQKWRAFVLDLSFIGWALLSVFTCGILSVFYVNPYKAATDAALYEALRYGNRAE